MMYLGLFWADTVLQFIKLLRLMALVWIVMALTLLFRQDYIDTLRHWINHPALF